MREQNSCHDLIPNPHTLNTYYINKGKSLISLEETPKVAVIQEVTRCHGHMKVLLDSSWTIVSITDWM